MPTSNNLSFILSSPSSSPSLPSSHLLQSHTRSPFTSNKVKGHTNIFHFPSNKSLSHWTTDVNEAIHTSTLYLHIIQSQNLYSAPENVCHKSALISNQQSLYPPLSSSSSPPTSRLATASSHLPNLSLLHFRFDPSGLVLSYPNRSYYRRWSTLVHYSSIPYPPSQSRSFTFLSLSFPFSTKSLDFIRPQSPFSPVQRSSSRTYVPVAQHPTCCPRINIIPGDFTRTIDQSALFTGRRRCNDNDATIKHRTAQCQQYGLSSTALLLLLFLVLLYSVPPPPPNDKSPFEQYVIMAQQFCLSRHPTPLLATLLHSGTVCCKHRTMAT